MIDFLKSFFAGEKTIAEKTWLAANAGGRDVMSVAPRNTGVDVHDENEEEGDCGAPCGGCGCG
jgi:hypothetical protein